MANYDTGKDIVEDMLSRAGELRLASAELSEEAKRYANRGYYNIIRQFQWLWAEKYPPWTLATSVAVKVKATVQPGSAGVVTDVLIPAGYGIKIVLERDGVPFRIKSSYDVEPPITTTPIGPEYTTNASIAVPYPFESGTDLPAWIYKDEYYVGEGDVLISTRISNMSKPYTKIAVVGYEELDATFPMSYPFGPISMASFYTEEIIRFAKIPEKPEVLEMFYVKRPPPLDFTGSFITDVPILPHDERWLIADYGLYFLMVDHGDDRAAGVAQIAAGRVAEIKDRQIAKMSPRIYLPESFSMNFTG